MAHTELKTTQDLEKEIRELEERLNKIENDPFLQSLLGRLIVLEVFAEAVAVYLAQRPEGQRELLEIMQRIPSDEFRGRIVDEASGMTAGQAVSAFIGHLESLSILRN